MHEIQLRLDKKSRQKENIDNRYNSMSKTMHSYLKQVARITDCCKKVTPQRYFSFPGAVYHSLQIFGKFLNERHNSW